jgi:hypothetical protein
MTEDLLYRNSDPKWRHLIGQRVQFLSRDRITGKNKSWVGCVEFIGVNDIHGKFQITVSRCPVWPVIVSSITKV